VPKLAAADLLAAVGSSDEIARFDARRELLRLKSDARIDVNVLIGGLDSENPEVAAYAAYSLRFLGTRVAHAIPRLVAQLGHPSVKAGQAALGALSLIDGRNSVARAAVLEALKHPQPAMRVQALACCVHLPDLAPPELARMAQLKRDPAREVVAQYQTTLHQLALLRGDPVPDDDELAEGEFDPEKFFPELTRTIRARVPFRAGLRHMLAWSARHLPHDDWKRVRALDVADDPRAAFTWVQGLLRRSPCPFPVRGLYFHLSEYTNARDEEYATLGVAFTGQHKDNDPQYAWARGPKRHDPPGGELRGRALKAAGVIFNRASGRGLGNEGYMMYAMSYATLLVASLMTPRLHAQFGTSDHIGLLVGWNSGDLMQLGHLTAKGFKARSGAMI
jgi:hypothetical protein